MKPFYSSKILKLFPKEVMGVMLFGMVFFRKPKSEVGWLSQNHEYIHQIQYWEVVSICILPAAIIGICLSEWLNMWYYPIAIILAVLVYYLWYVIEYLIKLVIIKCKGMEAEAYGSISFEQDAYIHERCIMDENKVCKGSRRMFAFLKYVRNFWV